MAEADSALLYMDVWKQKSFDFAKQSDDLIIPVMMKAFETMAATLEYQQNGIHLQRTLDSLKSEKDISYSYDNVSDPVRELTYGILEAIYRMLKSISTSQNQMTSTMEPPPSVDIPLIVGEVDGCCVKVEKSTDTRLEGRSVRVQNPIDAQSHIIEARLGEEEEERTENGAMDAHFVPQEHSSVGEVPSASDLLKEEETMAIEETVDEPPVNQATLYDNQRIPLDNVKLEMDEELFEAVVSGIASSTRAVSLAKDGGEFAGHAKREEVGGEAGSVEDRAATDEQRVRDEVEPDGWPLVDALQNQNRLVWPLCEDECRPSFTTDSVLAFRKHVVAAHDKSMDTAGLVFRCCGCRWQSRTASELFSTLQHVDGCSSRALAVVRCGRKKKMTTTMRTTRGTSSRETNEKKEQQSSKRVSEQAGDEIGEQVDDQEEKEEEEEPAAAAPSGPKRRRIAVNDGEAMKCPRCEYTSMRPSTLAAHAYINHGRLTPVLLGIFFRCSCGYQARRVSNKHKCPIGSFSVVYEENEPYEL